jgi:UV DNA damage repair endonuclease
MELDENSVMVIHGGGIYNNKEKTKKDGVKII